MPLTRDDLFVYFEAAEGGGVSPRPVLGRLIEFARGSSDVRWAGREYVIVRMGHAPVYESMADQHGISVRLGAANLITDPWAPMEWTLSGASAADADSCIQQQTAALISSTGSAQYVTVPVTGDYGAGLEGFSARLEQQGTRASCDVELRDDAGGSHAARIDWATGEVTLQTPGGSGLEIVQADAKRLLELGPNGGRLWDVGLIVQGTATRARAARIYPHRAADVTGAVVVHDAVWVASPLWTPPLDGTRARTDLSLACPDLTAVTGGAFVAVEFFLDSMPPREGEFAAPLSIAISETVRLSIAEFGPRDGSEFGGMVAHLDDATELMTTVNYERARVRCERMRLSVFLTDE